MISYLDCMESCKGSDQFFVENFPACEDEFTALNNCYGTVPTGTQNWICIDDFVPDAAACADQENTLISCLGG